jgi:transposase InsO family protein
MSTPRRPLFGSGSSTYKNNGMENTVHHTATVIKDQRTPWENGYCESFNARFRDELLNGEVFYTLREAQIIIEQWRRHYNTITEHSALGYCPPAPGAIISMAQRPAMHSHSNWTS